MTRTEKDMYSILYESSITKNQLAGLAFNKTISSTLHIYLLNNNSSISEDVLLSTLQQHPLTLAAQFDKEVEQRAIPDDPYFSSQWNLQNTGQKGGIPGADIKASPVWDICTGGTTIDGDTIVLAVIDNGFDLQHEDLNFWKNNQEIPNNKLDDDNNGYIDDYNGWNTKRNNDSLPVKVHGTHVCGIAGAKGNNHIGISGVNWGLKILPISYRSGKGFESNVISAYSYVLDQRKAYNRSNGKKGAFIVATNASFGIDYAKPADHPIWCAIYDSLGSEGILNIAATTNKNTDVDIDSDMPTACTSNWLITVTNTDFDDTKYNDAGYGKQTIDLGAPGTDIISSFPSNNYGSITGCSMAAPCVAGAVTLIYAAACKSFINEYKNDPQKNSLLVKNFILTGVDPVADLKDKTVSNGRLNLYKTLKNGMDYCNYLNPPRSSDHFIILSAYPVLTTQQLIVEYTNDSDAEMVLSNSLGQDILKIHCNRNDSGIIQQATIALTGISSGMYFIRMQAHNKQTKGVKIIF